MEPSMIFVKRVPGVRSKMPPWMQSTWSKMQATGHHLGGFWGQLPEGKRETLKHSARSHPRSNDTSCSIVFGC